MAKKKKVTNKGPHLRNAHLVGKGGGQVKPVDGSFVKGVKTARPTKSPANPNIKKHISTQPAKKNPENSPGRRRQLGSAKAKHNPNRKPGTAPVKAATAKTTTTPQRSNSIKKPTIPSAMTPSKKSPSKAAVSLATSRAKKTAPAKKVTPTKTRSAPKKGR